MHDCKYHAKLDMGHKFRDKTCAILLSLKSGWGETLDRMSRPVCLVFLGLATRRHLLISYSHQSKEPERAHGPIIRAPVPRGLNCPVA